MSIKRVILTSLFCVAMLFAAGKKAEAAFPYDMEQKPVMAASIKSEKVSVYEDVSLKKLLKEVNGSKLNIEAYRVSGKSIYGKYTSGKKSGFGWFSLDTFVVDPGYKMCMQQYETGCTFIRIEVFQRYRQRLKSIVGLSSSVKKMGTVR